MYAIETVEVDGRIVWLRPCACSTASTTARSLAKSDDSAASEIYARLMATKCRGATSLLRDIYLNADKPWGLEAHPGPDARPTTCRDRSANLVQAEVGNAARRRAASRPRRRSRTASHDLIAAAKRAALQKGAYRKRTSPSRSSTTSSSRAGCTRRWRMR